MGMGHSLRVQRATAIMEFMANEVIQALDDINVMNTPRIHCILVFLKAVCKLGGTFRFEPRVNAHCACTSSTDTTETREIPMYTSSPEAPSLSLSRLREDREEGIA